MSSNKSNWITFTPKTELSSLTGAFEGKQAEQHTRERNRETEIEKEGERERQAGWWADIAACLYDLDPAVDREGR